MDISTYRAVTIDQTVGGVALPSGVLTAPDGTQMNYFECRVETADIRWADDGVTVPSSAIGKPAKANDTFIIEGSAKAQRFRANMQTTQATLHVNGYRQKNASQY